MAPHVMAVKISGTRDGQDWPGVGQPVDLPNDELTEMVAKGLVVHVDDAVETATPPAPKTPAKPTNPETATPAKPETAAPAKGRGRGRAAAAVPVTPAPVTATPNEAAQLASGKLADLEAEVDAQASAAGAAAGSPAGEQA